MSNELAISATSGLTIYCKVRNAANQIWNTSGVAFEAWNGANIANYAAAVLTEDTTGGSSGDYCGTFPTGINTLGAYRVYFSVRSGGSAALTDAKLGSGTIYWDGSAEINEATYRNLIKTALTGINAPGTPGGLAVAAEGGTMQAGSTSTTAVLRAGASATDKLYNGRLVQIISGTGAGQARTIVNYVGSTKTATIHGAWVTTPDNTSVYQIEAGAAAVIDTSAGTLQAATSTTATLASTESATDNIFAGNLLKIVAGTGIGQARVIKSYVGSTKIATIDTAWITTPDTTSIYRTGLTELAALDSSLRPAASTVADISTLINTAIPNAAAGASGGLAKIGETLQLLDAADLAAVATAVWNQLTSAISTAGSIGLLLKTAVPNAAPNASGGIATIGETGALIDAVDAALIAATLLATAISPTVRPTIGTVAEALAAARAVAIGNKTVSGQAVAIKASDDSTTFSTLTFSPTIAAPTAAVRS